MSIFLFLYTKLEFSILRTMYPYSADDSFIRGASPTPRQDVALMAQVISRSLGAQMGASTHARHGSPSWVRAQRSIWGFRTSCSRE